MTYAIPEAAIRAAGHALRTRAGVDFDGWDGEAEIALRAALPHLAAIPTPSVIAVATIAAMALREAADALDAYDAKNAPPTDDRWTCDLGYYGEAEWLRDRAEQMLGALPRIARGYEIRPSDRGDHSIYIDGVEVPYCLAAPGPRIETRGAGLSILWLPVWTETPSPEVGRHDARPAPLAESTPTSARPPDSCGCDLCDLIATLKTGLDGGESCEHRWFEISRWDNAQRRWLRCSECGEAVEEAP